MSAVAAVPYTFIVVRCRCGASAAVGCLLECPLNRARNDAYAGKCANSDDRCPPLRPLCEAPAILLGRRRASVQFATVDDTHAKRVLAKSTGYRALTFQRCTAPRQRSTALRIAQLLSFLQVRQR